MHQCCATLVPHSNEETGKDCVRLNLFMTAQETAGCTGSDTAR
jgi:hypothetical protein